MNPDRGRQIPRPLHGRGPKPKPAAEQPAAEQPAAVQPAAKQPAGPEQLPAEQLDQEQPGEPCEAEQLDQQRHEMVGLLLDLAIAQLTIVKRTRACTESEANTLIEGIRLALKLSE